MSEILKRHTNTLSGDVALLKSNGEILSKEHELKVVTERIKNKIFTLEYQFFCTDENEYDCYEEFKNINDIKPHLAERPEIKVYRVLDVL